MKASNPSRQIKTAKVRESFFRSSQLQKGKKSVARMPPINNGIRKSLAKYNPAQTRNARIIFLITSDKDTFIRSSLLVLVRKKGKMLLLPFYLSLLSQTMTCLN